MTTKNRGYDVVQPIIQRATVDESVVNSVSHYSLSMTFVMNVRLKTVILSRVCIFLCSTRVVPR